MKPYIAVTGVRKREEVQAIEQALDGAPVDFPYVVHVPFIVRAKKGVSVAGDSEMQPVSTLFSPHRDVRNILVYAPNYSMAIDGQVAQLVARGGRYLDAITLSGWPKPQEIGVPAGVRVILKIGGRERTVDDNDPEQFVKRLRRYAGYIHGIEVSAFGGCSTPPDVESAAVYLRAAAEDRICKSFTLAIAGDFRADNLHLLDVLGDLRCGFSIASPIEPRDQLTDEIEIPTLTQFLAAAFAYVRRF